MFYDNQWQFCNCATNPNNRQSWKISVCRSGEFCSFSDSYFNKSYS